MEAFEVNLGRETRILFKFKFYLKTTKYSLQRAPTFDADDHRAGDPGRRPRGPLGRRLRPVLVRPFFRITPAISLQSFVCMHRIVPGCFRVVHFVVIKCCPTAAAVLILSGECRLR